MLVQLSPFCWARLEWQLYKRTDLGLVMAMTILLRASRQTDSFLPLLTRLQRGYLLCGSSPVVRICKPNRPWSTVLTGVMPEAPSMTCVKRSASDLSRLVAAALNCESPTMMRGRLATYFSRLRRR